LGLEAAGAYFGPDNGVSRNSAADSLVSFNCKNLPAVWQNPKGRIGQRRIAAALPSTRLV